MWLQWDVIPSLLMAYLATCHHRGWKPLRLVQNGDVSTRVSIFPGVLGLNPSFLQSEGLCFPALLPNRCVWKLLMIVFCTLAAGRLHRQAVWELEQSHGSAAAVAESEARSSKLPQHARYKELYFSSRALSTHSGLEKSSELSGRWAEQCALAGICPCVMQNSSRGWGQTVNEPTQAPGWGSMPVLALTASVSSFSRLSRCPNGLVQIFI